MWLNHSCQAWGRVWMCSNGSFSRSFGDVGAPLGSKDGAQTGNTLSIRSKSRSVPGQSGSPKCSAASKGSEVKLNGRRRVDMLIVISGCMQANSGNLGTNHRIPNVGRIARFKVPPTGATCSFNEAWAIWFRPCRTSDTYSCATGVSSRRLRSRRIRSIPNCASSVCNCLLTALWVRESSSATAEAEPNRSSASSARRDEIEGKRRRGVTIYAFCS